MTDFAQVFTWLNQFDRSHLKPTTEPNLETARNPQAAEAARTQALNAASDTTKRSYDLWEYPEFLLTRAGIEYQRQNYQAAADTIAEALAGYLSLPHSDHRQAVANWLAGCVQWKLRDHLYAVDVWRAAREKFVQMGEYWQMEGNQERADWYADKALDMSVALACTPEECYIWYQWLDQLEKFSPGLAQSKLQKRMVEAVRQPDHALVNQTIGSLVQLAKYQPNGQEKAEAYLACSMAKYQIQEPAEAYRYLRMAIAIYHPGVAHQALARWVLGAMQWNEDGLAEAAIKNWTLCLKALASLRERANWDKDTGHLKFYQDKMRLMELAFALKVQG